ncbi:hypothetical protein BP6252_08119 [Coleophoma cylindrospora]|uniref:Ricin B lectin domain-containing protein n=1 Tax=Coleophoma cylindrospora TaxID=1849047 RepID=A0A3D8RC75_9HELO|nr:hypothetical protein BP6252_08119 [Coleophoma cylindrospora]
MSNFHTNKWYQILVALPAKADQSMVGSVLNSRGGTGQVFFNSTNITAPEQQWQIFPYNSSYYVLRSKASDSFGYLNTAAAALETTLGNTVPRMLNSTYSDDSCLWKISPWGDGTFYFTNAANGSAWHLLVKPGSAMAMSSNITAPQTGQSFTFNATGTIDDSSYSSVILRDSTTVKSSSISISTSTASSTPTSSDSKGGLSTAASAAIGASIGGVAIIVLLILGFMCYRRRNKPKEGYAKPQSPDTPTKQPLYSEMPTSVQHTNEATELPEQHQPALELFEMDGNSRIPELPEQHKR